MYALCTMSQQEFDEKYAKHAPKESTGFGVGWAARREEEWRRAQAAKKAGG